jgi:hypothetical protein
MLETAMACEIVPQGAAASCDGKSQSFSTAGAPDEIAKAPWKPLVNYIQPGVKRNRCIEHNGHGCGGKSMKDYGFNSCPGGGHAAKINKPCSDYGLT